MRRRRLAAAGGAVLAVVAASWWLLPDTGARPTTTAATTPSAPRAQTRAAMQPVAAAPADRPPTEEVRTTGAIDGELVGFSDKARVKAWQNFWPNRDFKATVMGGHFTLETIPPGAYIVFAEEGVRTEEARIYVTAAGRTATTLTSAGTATLAGRVINLITRKPLGGLACQQGGHRGHHAVTDHDGRFELEIPAGRRVGISCIERGAHPRTWGGIEVELAPGSTQDVVIELIVRRHPFLGPTDVGFSLAANPMPRVGRVLREEVTRAGLIVGDQLLKVDGIDVSTFHPRQVEELMLDHAIGEKVELVLRRGGSDVTASVEVVEGKREVE